MLLFFRNEEIKMQDNLGEYYSEASITNMTGETRKHAHISSNITRILGNHLMGTPCIVYSGNLDLKVKGVATVQPDIMVVCYKDDADESAPDTFVDKVPELVVEIISASSLNYDTEEKKKIYFDMGVKEYWIITSQLRMLQVMKRIEKGFSVVFYAYAWTLADDESVKKAIEFNSVAFPDLSVNIQDIFDKVK
jgi:Uma2 family endonuclease